MPESTESPEFDFFPKSLRMPADSQSTILLIEDSETDRILIERLLQKSSGFPCEIVRTETLTAGLNRLDAGSRIEAESSSSGNDRINDIDAVLLDLTLPDSVGPEACERICEHHPTIPVVVLTGVDDESTALSALNHGAQDYLVKGQIDARLLSRSLRYAIERKKGEVALLQAHRQIESQQHQAELAHLARLNTMGEMASGMAHELNQPLTALVGFAETAITGAETGGLSGEQHRHILERIVSESQRAAEIIRRLRTLVRKRPPERGPTDIPELIQEAIRVVEHEAERSGCRIQVEVDEDLPQLEADRIQILQVILNLVKNGIEAMEEAAPEDRTLTISVWRNGRQIEVTVVDRGPRASEIDIDQLFQPYFTTKQKGLGMGLAICRSIIEAHAGQLSATRNVNHGLTFRFSLPLSAPSEQP